MRKLRRNIKKRFNIEHREYDIKGRLVYYRDKIDTEMFITYDNGKQVHCKKADGFEYWRDYNERGNLIHYKNSNGFEYWKQYNEFDVCIHYKNSKKLEEWYNDRGELYRCKFPDGTEEFYNVD